MPSCYETRPARSSLLVVLFVSALQGCSAAREESLAPAPNFAQSLTAGNDARKIDAVWRGGGGAERKSTEAALLRFIEQYPTDPRCRGMRLRLAYLRLEQQRLDEAERLLAVERETATGVDADWVVVVQGGILRRKGQAQAAIDTLLRIDQKIVDDALLPLFCDEAVRAALAVSRVGTAIDLMIEWLAYASEEQLLLARTEVQGLLFRIEFIKLALELERLSRLTLTPVAEPSLLQARQWIVENVRSHLATLALERGDANLGQKLIANAPTKFLRSELGERLRVMSERSAPSAPVIQPAIGLLLEMQDANASRRSAALMTGAMRALAESPGDFPVRLLNREITSATPSAITESLQALVADGAAIVIAGITAATDERARALALAEQGVVVTLTGDASPEGRYLFAVEEVAYAVDRLFPSAERGGPVRLWQTEPFCARASTSELPRAVVNAHRWLLLTDEDCARRLLAERPSEGNREIWLGPEAAPIVSQYPRAVTVLGQGLTVGAANEAAARWSAQFQRLPFWYEAVGFDVTRLSVAAMRQAQVQTAQGTELSVAARARVATALTQAKSQLMTSERGGFTETRRLVPTLVVSTPVASEPRGAEP